MLSYFFPANFPTRKIKNIKLDSIRIQISLRFTNFFFNNNLIK